MNKIQNSFVLKFFLFQIVFISFLIQAGELDTTFGPNNNGIVTSQIGTSDFALSQAIQADGMFVAV